MDVNTKMDIPFEIIGAIATRATQETLINIYACCSGMSFLALLVEDIHSERSFFIGSIVRATGDARTISALAATPMEKLRNIYIRL